MRYIEMGLAAVLTVLAAVAAWSAIASANGGPRDTGSSAFDSWQSWRQVESVAESCSGRTLAEWHPWSLAALTLWSRGLIGDGDFAAIVGLPDSELIATGTCVVATMRTSVPA